MRLSDGFITHDSEDEQIMVAVGENADRFHGIIKNNATAAFIVECLKNDTTEENIIDEILEKYDIDRETATKDVHSVITNLKTVGVIDD